MKHQTILFTNNIEEALNNILSTIEYNKLFILTDVNTSQFVLPKIENLPIIANATAITIKSGDINKNLEAATQVWKQLCDSGATRKSLVINLGGGMITDIGGFAASTFKRGIKFINLPTTLLGAVDAAIGGKTGINFNNLKNEIGVFNEAEAVIISTTFFKTLPINELKSGYAEMLKHGLLSDYATYSNLISYDLNNGDEMQLLELLESSVEVKRNIVVKDPNEHGIRRALNLGHTIGHAFESLAMKQNNPIAHGYAVAWGTVVELILSHITFKFDSHLLHEFANFVYENYGAFHITCDDYNSLIDFMKHDKKNEYDEINFSLLKNIGEVQINCKISADEVMAALDIYRDFMHI